MASDINNDDNTIIVMGDDDGTAPMAEVYNCPYQEVKDETMPCIYNSKSDIMIGMHERAIHLAKKATKVEIKDEVKGDTKKLKTIKRKVTTMFAENESRDEFPTKEGGV